jgi:predicted transposase/invertase (TIGR01784 family)
MFSMKFADVKNDIAFRKIFGNENKKEVLISFLNAVLDLEEQHKIAQVTIINPFQLPKFRDGKATIIDVKAKDQSGREFVVEMQVANAVGFSKRVLYYASQGYVSQIDRGEFYDKLNPTIFVGILDFVVSTNPKYISRHRILDVETGERLMEDMEFNFVELPKFKVKRKDLTTLVEKWIYFITEAEYLEVIPDDIDDAGLRSAFEQANIQTWSKAELEAYDYAGMRETEERLRFEKRLENMNEALDIAKKANETANRDLETTNRDLETANRDLETAKKANETANRDLETANRDLETAQKASETAAKHRINEVARQMKMDKIASDVIQKYTGLTQDDIDKID